MRAYGTKKALLILTVGFIAGIGLIVDQTLAAGQTNCSVECQQVISPSITKTITAYSQRDCASNEVCKGSCTIDEDGDLEARAWCEPA